MFEAEFVNPRTQYSRGALIVKPDSVYVVRHNEHMPKSRKNRAEIPPTELWKRLARAAAEAGLKTTQQAMADLVGVAQSSARKWLTGESLPTLENAIALGERLNLCVEYIFTGRGPISPEPIDPEWIALSSLWSAISPTERTVLRATAETLAHGPRLEVREPIPFPAPPGTARYGRLGRFTPKT